MISIHWTPEALASLVAVFRYHLQTSSESAERIRDAILKTVSRLERFPELAPLKTQSIRCLAVQKYPYSCWYRLAKGGITILLIKHDKQAPILFED